MELSDEPLTVQFSVGPSSLIGRAVVLKVLFCKSMREFLTATWAFLTRYLRQGTKLIKFTGIRLFSLVNPRQPSILLTAIVAAGILVRQGRTVKLKAEISYRRNFWKNMMNSVNTYDEWAHAANMLEKICHRRQDSDLYDEELVRAKLFELRQRRLEGSIEDILFCLRTDLVRNLGNMCNPELHKGRLQTPKLIHDYIDEVRYHLRAVCEKNSEEFSLEEKIAFIHETRHAFGRTALLLSGGAALGAFHLGVLRTLIEHHFLPKIIAGVGVGSIICSFVASRTSQELHSFFEDPYPHPYFFETLASIFSIAYRLHSSGMVQDLRLLQRRMRQLIGDLSFQEAFELSGRVLGISVTSTRRHDPPRCLSYLTAPCVVIWSAVTASCACPSLLEAQELMAKDRHGQIVPYRYLVLVGQEEASIGGRHWRDGSYESDLPLVHLKELFNVNHFIVSQANHHIAPFLRVKEAIRTYGGDFAGKLAHMVEMEVKHRCKQALELGISLGGLTKFLAQDWEGDITIVIPATLYQFTKSIQNITSSDLRKAVMQGRRSTWAKLSAIQANCGIELMLDECVAVLKHQRHMQNNVGKNFIPTVIGGSTWLGSAMRTPSWICLAWENSPGNVDDESTEASMPQMQVSKSVGHISDNSHIEGGLECIPQMQPPVPVKRSSSASSLVVLVGFDNNTAIDV